MNQPAPPVLWQRLVQWQPADAAALAAHCRNLPDDWPLRVFGVGRTEAALLLPPAATGEQYPDRAPEIAPYDEIAALDDCPACEEAEGLCRWHEGYAAAHHGQTQAQLDVVKARPDITLREFMLWQADVAEAEDRAATPPELPAAQPHDKAVLRARTAEAINADLATHKGRLDQGLLGIVPRLTDAVMVVRDAELADVQRRAEQAEDLLHVAHETSNRSEAERARAETVIAEVRRLCELTIRASIRVHATEHARDTLAVIDRVTAREAQPAVTHAERRDRLAAGIYEYWNPGCAWSDAHADDLVGYRTDADAAMTVADALAGRGAALRTTSDTYREVAARLDQFAQKDTPGWARYCGLAARKVDEWAAQMIRPRTTDGPAPPRTTS